MSEQKDRGRERPEPRPEEKPVGQENVIPLSKDVENRDAPLTLETPITPPPPPEPPAEKNDKK